MTPSPNDGLTRLLTALHDGGPALTESDAEALAARYPFFALPAVMLLQHDGASLAPAVRNALLRRIALNTPDSDEITARLRADHPEWASFYPAEEHAAPSTNDVIATFLDTYGHSDPAEEALLERLIFNPTPDYSTLLSMEEEESLPEPASPGDTSQDALISQFILSHRDPEAEHTREPEPTLPLPPATQPAAAKKATADNSSLTESLAKIYIRQKRFDKAFEIIHTLSLNNPKKSAYFADQLRFLRKVMLAQELKKARTN